MKVLKIELGRTPWGDMHDEAVVLLKEWVLHHEDVMTSSLWERTLDYFSTADPGWSTAHGLNDTY